MTDKLIRIVQGSDSHFGDKECKPKLFDKFVNYVNDYKPDLFIFNGDVTDHGRWREWDKARSYFDKLELQKDRVCINIGNHDVKNGYNGFTETFNEYLYKETARSKIVKPEEFLLLGLESTLVKDSPALGNEQVNWVNRQFKKYDNGYTRMVSLHHHIIPCKGVKSSAVVDAGDLIHLMLRYKVKIGFSGHWHLPNAYKLNDDTFLINAGTVCTLKQRHKNEKPNFNIIESKKGYLKVTVVNTKKPENKRVLLYHSQGKTYFITDGLSYLTPEECEELESKIA